MKTNFTLAIVSIMMLTSVLFGRTMNASYKFEAISKPSHAISIKRNTVTAKFNTVTGIVSLRSTFGAPRVDVWAYDYNDRKYALLIRQAKANGDYRWKPLWSTKKSSEIASIEVEVSNEFEIDYRDRYQISCKSGYTLDELSCVEDDDYVEHVESFDADGCFYGEVYMTSLKVCINVDTGSYHAPYSTVTYSTVN